MKYLQYWKAIVLLMSIGLIQGCATLGHDYKDYRNAPKDKALVYVYRPSNFVGGGVSYYVYANDKIITNLHNDGYYPFYTEPGNVEFWARTEAKSSVDMVLEAGETYYLKGTVTMGIMIGRPYLSAVSKDIGKEEIKGCNFIPEKDWEEEKREEERNRGKVLDM